MSANLLFILFLTMALLAPIGITGMGLVAFPRTEANGHFITTSTTIKSVTDDKFNEVIDLSTTVTYIGTLEGTSNLQGTLTFNLVGSSDLYQAIQLTNTITSGTDGLASLQGELSKIGIIKDNGPIGTYTGQITNQ